MASVESRDEPLDSSERQGMYIGRGDEKDEASSMADESDERVDEEGYLLFITTFHYADGSRAYELEVPGKDLEEGKKSSHSLAAYLKLTCGETVGPVEPLD